MAWAHRTIKQEWAVVALSKDHPQSAIAAKTGLSKAAVYSIQRKYHITMSFGRSYSSARFRYAYDKKHWRQIISLLYWDQGLSMEETATRCNIEVGTLRRRMDELRIGRRTPWQSNKGRKRKPYNYRPDLPECPTPGCRTKVTKEGRTHCAACTRSASRRGER